MSARFRALGLQFLGFLDRFFDAADHVERLFWQVVVVTVEDAFEASNGVFQGNVFTRGTGEDFSHEERLRQETCWPVAPLHAARSSRSAARPR